MRPLARFGRSDGGQAVVLIAIVMSGLLLGTGLAIDAGRLFVVRREAQAASDAAAWAGAVVMRGGGSAAQAISAATTDATANRYTTGSGITVTVTSPPGSGTYAGNTQYIEVTITASVATVLLPSALTTVSVRSVAGVAPIDQKYAVVALDSASTPSAVSVGSQGSLVVSGGGIMVNSSSQTAGSNAGNVTVTPSTSGTDVVGNATETGQGTPWPNKQTARPVLPDPYLNFPMPDISDPIAMPDRGTPTCCTLSQGVYTGSINATGSEAWVLNPGIYVFKGGGIDMGGQSSVTGAGVMIFITTSTYPAVGGTCASFNGNTVKLRGGSAGSSLSAPTSGTYQGMLLYQDPACTGDISVGGGGSITGIGTIYAPTALVQGNGNIANIAVSQVVSKRLDLQNAGFTFTYSSAVTASPRIPALSE